MTSKHSQLKLSVMSLLLFSASTHSWGQSESPPPPQNYPSTSQTNNSTPPSGAPTQLQGTIPSTQQNVTENGAQPGAQMNFYFNAAQGATPLTPQQITAAETQMNTDIQNLNQATGSSFPTPNYYVVGTGEGQVPAPVIDSNTGFVGATSTNIISEIVVVPSSYFTQYGTPPKNGLTQNTNDPTNDFATSSLSYVDPTNLSAQQVTNLVEHEPLGHGVLNLTDCTGSCNSVMLSTSAGRANGLTTSDISVVKKSEKDPVPPPPPPPCQ